MQQRLPFAPFSSYKTFRTASVNNMESTLVVTWRARYCCPTLTKFGFTFSTYIVRMSLNDFLSRNKTSANRLPGNRSTYCLNASLMLSNVTNLRGVHEFKMFRTGKNQKQAKQITYDPPSYSASICCFERYLENHFCTICGNNGIWFYVVQFADTIRMFICTPRVNAIMWCQVN